MKGGDKLTIEELIAELKADYEVRREGLKKYPGPKELYDNGFLRGYAACLLLAQALAIGGEEFDN